MRLRSFTFRLGRLEVLLQFRLGRGRARPCRRYRPIPRGQLESVHERLLRQLHQTFVPDKTP